MHPTPLRVGKIVAILKVMSTRSPSRSIRAARVMGIPLGAQQGFYQLQAVVRIAFRTVEIFCGTFS
jgi:hypothetical protein